MPEPNLEDLENFAAPHQFALLAHEWDLLDSVVSNGAQNLKNVAKILTRVSLATETYGKELQKIVADHPPTTDIEPMSKLLEMISQFISNLGSAALNLHAGISSHVTRGIIPTTTKIDSVRETTRKQSKDFQTRLKIFRNSVEKERPACLNEWQQFLRARKTATTVEKEIVAQDARANSSQKIMKLQAKQAELDQKTRLQKFKVRQQFSDFENLIKSRNDTLFREYGPEFYGICGALENAQTQSMRKVVATYSILPALVSSYTTALSTCVMQFCAGIPANLTSSFVPKGIRTVIGNFLKTRAVYRDLEPFLVGLPCSALMIQEGTWHEERGTFVLPRKENLELQDSILSDQCGFLNVLRENRWVRAFVRVEASELTAPDLGGLLISLWMCKVQRLAPDEMQREWCFKISSAANKPLSNGTVAPPTILTICASNQMERDKWLFMLENVVDTINSKDPVDDGPIFPTHGNYVSEREKEVLEVVFTEDMTVAKKMSHTTNKRADADKLSVALINLAALEGFRATQLLMRVFVETEVANSTSETLLFRTDSIASKMLAVYVRETASAWLHSALFTSIGELVLDASDDGKSFEINPNALQPNLTSAEQVGLLEWAQAEGTIAYSTLEETKDKEKVRASAALPRSGSENQNITLLKVQIHNNLRRLENAVAKILDHLVDSIRYVPRKLRWMLQMVQEVVLDKFPETRWSCVSAFVFLRFLCPTVSTATLWKDTSLPNARRNLLLVTKVLQSMANRSLFTSTSKEGYMNILNPYMRTELSRVDSFCHSFIWPAPPLRDSCVSDSPACLRSRVATLAVDFEFLHGMIHDIKQDIKRDELWANETPSPSPPSETKVSISPSVQAASASSSKKYATWTPTALVQPVASATQSTVTRKSIGGRASRSGSRAYPPPPLPLVPPPSSIPLAGLSGAQEQTVSSDPQGDTAQIVLDDPILTSKAHNTRTSESSPTPPFIDSPLFDYPSSQEVSPQFKDLPQAKFSPQFKDLPQAEVSPQFKDLPQAEVSPQFKNLPQAEVSLQFKNLPQAEVSLKNLPQEPVADMF